MTKKTKILRPNSKSISALSIVIAIDPDCSPEIVKGLEEFCLGSYPPIHFQLALLKKEIWKKANHIKIPKKNLDQVLNQIQLPAYLLKGIDLPKQSLLRAETFRPSHAPYQLKELMDIVQDIRELLAFPNDSFLVYISPKDNAANWFSFFNENRNIYINSKGWGKYFKNKQVFPVIYQIIANVLQQISFGNISKAMPFVHLEESLGCMNDFCVRKKDVIFKMRTADICGVCEDRLRKSSVSSSVLDASFLILESVCKKMRFRGGSNNLPKPSRLRIQENGDIEFTDWNKVLKLTPLEKSMFHFFLNHPEGIRKEDLSFFENEFMNYYKTYSPKIDFEDMRSSILGLLGGRPNSFSEQKSRLRKKLKKLLPDSLLNIYEVTKNQDNQHYRILLDRSLIIQDL